MTDRPTLNWPKYPTYYDALPGVPNAHACVECGEPTMRGSTPPPEGFRRYGGRGMCAACYVRTYKKLRRAHDAAERPVPELVALQEPGMTQADAHPPTEDD